jgi:hypothetical protein
MDQANGAATIKQAAEALGITPVAVRKRLVRGKLPGHKDAAGQWIVPLTDELIAAERARAQATDQGLDRGSPRVIARLEDEVRYLRDELRRERESRGEELRRTDVIIAAFAERLPELPATTSPPEPPARSWWQRLWGGA